MAEAATHLPMSVRQFFAWEGEPDVRYELWHGTPVAMTPPLAGHQAIMMALGRHLSEALDRRPDCLLLGEAGVAPEGSDSDLYFIADLGVTCGEVDADERTARAPVLLVEILSDSTERHDRRTKLPAYRAMPAVQEILLIDPRRVYCEVLRRTPEGWLHQVLLRRDDVLRLESVGLAVDLGAIYARVPLPREAREDAAAPSSDAGAV